MNKPERSLIVGIAGGTASGKTTLAEAVADRLRGLDPPQTVTIITADTYFRLDDPKAPQLYWSLKNEFVFDFNQLDSADYARLEGDLRNWSTAAGHPDCIIVEGLMVFAIPGIREQMDVRFFVDLEADVRLGRRLLRDMKSARRRYSQPDEIVSYYLESARVGHLAHVEPSRIHADVTVRGDADIDRTARMLAAIVRDIGREKEEDNAGGENKKICADRA